MNKEQIPEFAREDFLNSEAPYKWLEENSVNKFEEMQLTEMLVRFVMKWMISQINPTKSMITPRK